LGSPAIAWVKAKCIQTIKYCCVHRDKGIEAAGERLGETRRLLQVQFEKEKSCANVRTGECRKSLADCDPHGSSKIWSHPRSVGSLKAVELASLSFTSNRLILLPDLDRQIILEDAQAKDGAE
jgi:hypothetical protein